MFQVFHMQIANVPYTQEIQEWESNKMCFCFWSQIDLECEYQLFHVTGSANLGILSSGIAVRLHYGGADV